MAKRYHTLLTKDPKPDEDPQLGGKVVTLPSDPVQLSKLLRVAIKNLEHQRKKIAQLSNTNQQLEEKLPNTIVRLVDSDRDGRFDAPTVFADKMTFPMGGVWHAGALYVASPPNIWRLRDTDDDGVADDRTATGTSSTSQWRQRAS